MQLMVTADAEALAQLAAVTIADEAARAIARSGSFAFAVSGGRTPRRMLELLVERDDIDWPRVAMFQVDERMAPEGHTDRNLTMLRSALLDHVDVGAFHPMPVDGDPADYERLLPDALDLVQLGLGDDGHTASLVPGDPVLEEAERQVAVTGEYQGRRRMTLTAVALGRAKRIVWVVSGADKSAAVVGLFDGDQSIPAALVPRDRALLLADRASMSPPKEHET
jgi:6-phosphogluconolactonase